MTPLRIRFLYSASSQLRVFATVCVLMAVPIVAHAENWVQYYRIGTVLPSGTIWTGHELDADSLVRDGEYIRYKTRLNHPEEGLVGLTQMRANCATGTRGELPGESMYSTYKGTLGGQEVTTACALAGGRGLLK